MDMCSLYIANSTLSQHRHCLYKSNGNDQIEST